MKQLLILLYIIGISGALSAQQKWTLSECIHYALEQNPSLLKMKGKRAQLQIKHGSIKNQRLPAVEINSTQRFDFGRSLNRENVYQDVNSRATAFNLNIEMPVFKGFQTKHALKEAEFEANASEEEIQTRSEELRMQVINFFFRAMVYKEVADIAEQQKQLTEDQLAKAHVRVSAGMAPKSLLPDIQTQLAEDELAIVEAKANEENTLMELARIMSLRVDENGFDIHFSETDHHRHGFTTNNRFSQMQSAKYHLQSLEAAYRKVRSGYFPSLSLGASTGSNYYHRNGMENDIFSKQMKNNLQSYVYATLHIPVFNRFAVRDNLRSMQTEIRNQQLTLREIENELTAERHKANANVRQATQKLTTAQTALESNIQSFNHATERFNAGKISVYEYGQAKQKLANAQSQVAQAKYDLLFKNALAEYYNRPN